MRREALRWKSKRTTRRAGVLLSSLAASRATTSNSAMVPSFGATLGQQDPTRRTRDDATGSRCSTLCLAATLMKGGAARPRIPAVTEEMKAWSAALGAEVTSWPQVSTRVFFWLYCPLPQGQNLRHPSAHASDGNAEHPGLQVRDSDPGEAFTTGTRLARGINRNARGALADVRTRFRR